MVLLLAATSGVPAGWASSPVTAKARKDCKVAFEGEVKAGQRFAHGIDGMLEFVVEPIASGWIVRVRPQNGETLRHDYAELATPPYQSVSPLLISTDYSFRAQDAVGWNPRRFAYAADRASFEKLQSAFDRYKAGGSGGARAQAELSAMVMRAPQGELKILDSHLVAGTADQWRMAAGVATHFTTTAHTIEAPGPGESVLGRVTWMRFRVTLDRAGCR